MSSFSSTLKVCASFAVPEKVSVCVVVTKSAASAVPAVKSTSKVNPPSTTWVEIAVKVITPSSATVTSSIVTAVVSLSVIERLPVSVVVTSRPFNGVLGLTAKAMLKLSVVASTRSSSVIATVNVLSPVSPAIQVTLWVALAKSLPSPPKPTSMLRS